MWGGEVTDVREEKKTFMGGERLRERVDNYCKKKKK